MIAKRSVARKLRAGWRPAKSRELTWVKGSRPWRDGEDMVEDLEHCETAVMTADEEQVLIHRVWSDG